MDAAIIYQQDTLEAITPALEALSNEMADDTLKLQTSSAAELQTKQDLPIQKKFTNEQIRKWRMRQESKMFIDSTKNISRREAAELSTSEQPQNNFILTYSERKFVNKDRLTIIMIVGILIFATVRYSYSKYMEKLFL